MKKKRYNLKQKITITIRPDVIQQIDDLAERQFTSRSGLIETVMRQYMIGRLDNGEASEKPVGDRG